MIYRPPPPPPAPGQELALTMLLVELTRLGQTAQAPSPRQAELAYVLGMLAADLTCHPPSDHLLAICQELGVGQEQAEHIGCVLATLIQRLASLTPQEVPYGQALTG